MKCMIALAIMAVLSFAPAAHAGENPFVGEVETFGFNYCPSGWLPTNGALLPIATYTVLYEVLGTQYGGDGVTSFGVPDTRPARTKTRADLTQCIAYLGVYPSKG